MYKAVLRLVAWPKGSIYISEVSGHLRTIELLTASTDQEAVATANYQASILKGSLALQSCLVIRIFEIKEREVPLQ